MTSKQLAAAIQALIAARDNEGADVQPVIDELFAKWEVLNAASLSAPIDEHVAHDAAVGGLG